MSINNESTTNTTERRGVRHHLARAGRAAGNLVVKAARALAGPEELTPEAASIRKAAAEYNAPLPVGSAAARADAVLQGLVGQSGGGGPEVVRMGHNGRVWTGVGQERSVVFGDSRDPKQEAGWLVRRLHDTHGDGVIYHHDGQQPAVLASAELPASPFGTDCVVDGVYVSRSVVDDYQDGRGTKHGVRVAVQSTGRDGYRRRDYFTIDRDGYNPGQPRLHSEVLGSRQREYRAVPLQYAPEQPQVDAMFGQVMDLVASAQLQPVPELVGAH